MVAEGPGGVLLSYSRLVLVPRRLFLRVSSWTRRRFDWILSRCPTGQTGWRLSQHCIWHDNQNPAAALVHSVCDSQSDTPPALIIYSELLINFFSFMKQNWSFVLFPDGFSLIYRVLVWSRYSLILLMSWSWLVGAVLATTLAWSEGCLGAVRPLIPPDAASPPRLLSESFICREIYVARRRCGSQQIYRAFSYDGCVSTYVPAHIHRGGFILIQGGGSAAACSNSDSRTWRNFLSSFFFFKSQTLQVHLEHED